MKKNSNRPKKGSIIRVEPIRAPKDIATIKQLLSHNPRNYALFVIGVNTNLRASDLLSIKVKDVKYLQAMGKLTLREKKTGKVKDLHLNTLCVDAIQKLLASHDYQDDNYLFRSYRAPVLTVSSLSRLVKGWCGRVNMPGNYGSHTLRKTWAYQQYTNYGMSLPTLMKCLNHSSQKETLIYLCITDVEIKNVYANEI
jgi:integrase